MDNTCPSKMERTSALSLVAISTPLLLVVTFGNWGCWCVPKLLTTIPFSTGHGSFPLLFVKLAASALSSAVKANSSVFAGLVITFFVEGVVEVLLALASASAFALAILLASSIAA